MENQDIWRFLREKDINKLQEILEKDPQRSEEKNETGISLILYAAYCGFEEAVKLIHHTKERPLDLYEATVVGDERQVQLLLKESQSLLNKANVDGFTPLGLACFFAKKPLVNYLLKSGANPNQPSENQAQIYPINSAAAIGNVEIVALLLQAGADVNKAQASGVTALHSAVHLGNLPLTQLLLEKGADRTAKTQDKKLPIDFLELNEPGLQQAFEKALQS